MASVSFLSELPFSRDRLLFVVVVVADSSAAVTTLGLVATLFFGLKVVSAA